MTAERQGIALGEMMMVAAHAWDITGAAAAGCRTAFIARPGKVLNPAGSQPDPTGSRSKSQFCNVNLVAYCSIIIVLQW